MTDAFLPLSQVGRALGLSDNALRMRLRRGQLPFEALHEGRRIIVRRSDVEAYVANLKPVEQLKRA